jgi:predicted small lipoprotein YifL
MILNVNSTFIFVRTLFIVAVSANLLNACGQRGPLYLPAKAAPADATQNQPASSSTTTTTIPASK